MRDPGRPANGIRQACQVLLGCFGGSQYGAIHAITATRPARGHAWRGSRGAGPKVNSVAARHQPAALEKSGFTCGTFPETTDTRATRRGPRELNFACDRPLA